MGGLDDRLGRFEDDSVIYRADDPAMRAWETEHIRHVPAPLLPKLIGVLVALYPPDPD